MKPPQEGRNTGAPSLRGLQGRSATGLNGQAAKDEVSAVWRGLDAGKYFWRSGREKCFSLDIPFNRILLDNQLLHLCGLRLPVRFLQREKSVAHEPPERHGAIVHDSASRIHSRLLRDLLLQPFPCLKLRKL